MNELSVEVPGVVRRARSVCEIAEDLRIVARNWEDSLESPGGSLEVAEATEAVDAMRTAWGDDFAVYLEVLQQWCQAVQGWTVGTVATDGQSADDLQAIAVSRSALPR